MSDRQDYALLPVWLLSTQWNGQNFLFAVNGQSGEMTGNLPVDRTKQIIWNIIYFVPVFLIIAFLTKFQVNGMIIAAVIALIVDLIANNNVKVLKKIENDDVYMTLKQIKNYFGETYYYVSAMSYDGQLDISVSTDYLDRAEKIFNKVSEYENTPPDDNDDLLNELEKIA